MSVRPPDRPARAVLLRHAGHGRLHWDLVVESGARCLTVALQPGPHGWRWRLQPAHRRRYLGYRGAIPAARGRVGIAWSGRLRWWRHGGGLQVLLLQASMTLRAGGVVIPATPPHCPPWLRFR